MNQVTELEELDEEEMMIRAIAMSLEDEEKEEEEKEEREVTREELSSIKIQGSGELLALGHSAATRDNYHISH